MISLYDALILRCVHNRPAYGAVQVFVALETLLIHSTTSFSTEALLLGGNSARRHVKPEV